MRTDKIVRADGIMQADEVIRADGIIRADGGELEMRLSKRLELVVAFAEREQKRTKAEETGGLEEPGGVLRRVADVGTDHGYVPIALVLRNPAVRAIAMDVRPGPLERAKAHIGEHGLEERIETRLGDGVEKLKEGEADTVIIAGMGGELVIHILEGGRRLWKTVERWILSPQSELDKVRRYLDSQGFVIADEAMVEDEGKYYTVMEAAWTEGAASLGDAAWPRSAAGAGEAARPGGMAPSVDTALPAGAGEAARSGGAAAERDELLEQAGYLYGPRLIEKRDPVLTAFLEREERQLTEIIRRLESQGKLEAAARREELVRRRSLARRAWEAAAGSEAGPRTGGESEARGESDI